MPETTNTWAGFVIIPANYGGYIVRDMPPTNMEMAQSLFAGTLDECLAFIRDHILKD